MGNFLTNRTLFLLRHLLLLTIFSPATYAIINLGGDNSFNTTDPATGAPWDSVARVADYDGASVTSSRGSAVYLGFGYVLTANHVNVNNNTWVSFDGSSWLQRDTSVPTQQVAANVDMKVFKLQSTPSASAVNLYGGNLELIAPATMIGWGRGRNPATPVNSTTVPWGDNSTIDKRWGNNVPRDFVNLAYQAGSYTTIRTVLGSNTGTPSGLGDSEAAATLFDSGSGLFQQQDGIWHLIGLTTAVQTSGSSNYGDDVVLVGGDANYFARISDYEDEILALIPEPQQFAAVLAISALGICFFRRR